MRKEEQLRTKEQQWRDEKADLMSRQTGMVQSMDKIVAPVDVGVERTLLKHPFDLDRLLKRVDELFKWFVQRRPAHLAPYFPLVQSS